MVTQLEPVRAVRPAASVAVEPLPRPSVLCAPPVAPPRTVVDVRVPVIRPYLVAHFRGAAVVAASPGAIRSTPAVGAVALGVLSIDQTPLITGLPVAGGVGSGSAKIAVKSGKALVSATLAGVGSGDSVVALAQASRSGSEGVAVATFSVIATTDAVFGAEGRYSGMTPQSAVHAGVGALSAATGLTGAVVIGAAPAGAGTLTAVPGAGVNVSGNSVGELSASTACPASAGASGSSDATVSARAAATAGSSGSGSLSADARSSFVPSSMTKAGTWASMDATWRTITGWSADTAAYPGSTVSGEGLVVQKSKADATLAASVVFKALPINGPTVTLQLLVNNVSTVVGTPTVVPANSTATVTVSAVRNITAGDVVIVQAKSTLNFPNYNPTAGPDPASFVRVT